MLLLGPRWKVACTILQVVPPGVGATIAGAKNPHSRYLGRGIAQLALVLFGSWPLLIPGAVGLIWAWTDAYRIATQAVPPGAMSRPTPDADPETLPAKRAKKPKENGS